MKIEKAIEHLNAVKESGEYLGDPDDSRAIQLGIEALKVLKVAREESPSAIFRTLPGETKT